MDFSVSFLVLFLVRTQLSFKPPAPGSGPWDQGSLHGRAYRTLLGRRRAGNHLGPGCPPDHPGRDRHHHGLIRSWHWRRRHLHECDAPRQRSVPSRSGEGWPQPQRHNQQARQIQQRRSSRSMLASQFNWPGGMRKFHTLGRLTSKYLSFPNRDSVCLRRFASTLSFTFLM